MEASETAVVPQSTYPKRGIHVKTLCHCCPLNGCLCGKQVPFSSGLHTDTQGFHFLWLLVFAYTPPLSSCLLALASCQADREFVPTQWQVSDGKALCPKKTLRPLFLTALPPSHPLSSSLVFTVLPFALLSKQQQALPRLINTPARQHFHMIIS